MNYKHHIYIPIILIFFSSCDNKSNNNYIYRDLISINIPFEFKETDNDRYFDTYNKVNYVIIENINKESEQLMIENFGIDNIEVYKDSSFTIRLDKDYDRMFKGTYDLRTVQKEKGGWIRVYSGYGQKKKVYRGYICILKNYDYIFLKYINLDTIDENNANFKEMVESIHFLK